MPVRPPTRLRRNNLLALFRHRKIVVVCLAVGLAMVRPAPGSAGDQPLVLDYRGEPPFHEQVAWHRTSEGIRVCLVAPERGGTPLDRLIVYATPNGNTIEQTLGCSAIAGRDFHFDIQHVAAQTRGLREVGIERNSLLAIVEAPGLSWPSFRRDHANANQLIHDLTQELASHIGASRFILAGHSGGGSYVFGYVDACETLPTALERIVFLDANYAYSDELRHGEKLIAWLGSDASSRLVVIAYDDREIELNGKKVVGPDGGTFRATQRMVTRFRQDMSVEATFEEPFQSYRAMDDRIHLLVHPNPDNKILHTALVGEMNGWMHGLTLGTKGEGTWGTFGGPRAYTAWIQAEPWEEPAIHPPRVAPDAPPDSPRFPPCPTEAVVGKKFCQRVTSMSPLDREQAIEEALALGNFPNYLRRFVPLQVTSKGPKGANHTAVFWVMPDYLSVGSDTDFVRMPMMPVTARKLADRWDASLITAKVARDCFQAAASRLEPIPLTEARESVTTFQTHHEQIETQLHGMARGVLIAGIKKDVVLSAGLQEREDRVAIYGWHRPHGIPIQPLYLGHIENYVDYSHGIRLMSQRILVDGQEQRIADVLRDPELACVLSDEGPFDSAGQYRKSAP